MSASPSRPDVSKLTPVERARLAMEMLKPKTPTKRVVDAEPAAHNDGDDDGLYHDTTSGNASGGEESQSNPHQPPVDGKKKTTETGEAEKIDGRTTADAPGGMPELALAPHAARGEEPKQEGEEEEEEEEETGKVVLTTDESAGPPPPPLETTTTSAVSSSSDTAAEETPDAAEVPPAENPYAKKPAAKANAGGASDGGNKTHKFAKFLSGIAGKMEEKMDKVKHEISERRARAGSGSGGSGSGDAVGAVFSALGMDEMAAEASDIVRSVTNEEKPGAAVDRDHVEEQPGSVEVATGSGAEEGIRKRKGGGDNNNNSSSSSDKKKSAAAAAASSAGAAGSAATPLPMPDMKTPAPSTPTVTAEDICRRLLKSNLGLMRTEYQLSSTKLSFLEFVVQRALGEDPEIIYDETELAFAMLSLNVGTIHRDTWVKVGDALPCIAHESLMGDVFDAVTRGGKTMTWPTFERFCRELLRAHHPVDETWEKASKRGDIPSDEPLVARFTSVTNRGTRPSVAGTLFVTRDHLVHMSSVLAKVTARVPLSAVKGWSVVPCGTAMLPGREVVVDLHDTAEGARRRSLEFGFPYMTDIRTRGEEKRADEFARCLGELEATRKYAAGLAERRAEAEGWATFATQHLILARAIREAGGTECEALYLSSNPSKRDNAAILEPFEKRHILSRGKRPVVFRSKRDPQSYRGVPFDMMLFAHHIDTLIDCIEPYNVAERFVLHVVHWRSPGLTAALFAACLALAWLDLVRFLPSLLLVLTAYLVHSLCGMTTIEGVQVCPDEERKQAGFFSNLKSGFDKMHTVHDGLQTTQNKLFKQNVRMLKVQSLFLQRAPEISRMFAGALVAAAVALAFVPARWLWTAAVLHTFTWKFRSRDKSLAERKFDSVWDSIPPVNPVNARPGKGKDKEKEKEAKGEKEG